MGTVAVKIVRVTGFLGVFDLEQFAGVIEGPAMERAGISRLVAPLEATEHRAAMAAGVDEGVEFTLLVARNEDRLTTHVGRVIVVLFGNLAVMGKVDPVALEDVLHLQFEQTLVGEHFAFAAKDAFVSIVFNKRIKVVASQVPRRGLHCYCSGETKAIPAMSVAISALCSIAIRFLQRID